MMEMIAGITAVFNKDLKTEFRSRYVLNTVLAFVGAALLIILFSLKATQLSPTAKSGLVWIVILFAALSALARSFVMETDRLTFDLLRIHGRSPEIFLGKLCYNFAFSFLINGITFILYIFLMDLPAADPAGLLAVLLLGTLGFSSVATLLAAIVSQADRKGAIFSVMSIPLLFPLILILVEATKTVLIGENTSSAWDHYLALTGYCGATISAGILLFEYIWED